MAEVRIAGSRAVVIDGRLRAAGEVVEVPEEDAAKLRADGYAEAPETPRQSSQKPKRTSPRKGGQSMYDDAGLDASESKTADGRKALTVEALEAGEGERG